MIILSPRYLKLLKFLINYAYFFRVIPFNWCENRNGVYRVKTSRLNLYKWDVIKYIILIHQVFLIIRLWQSIMEAQAKELKYVFSHLSIYIREGMYFLGLLVAALLQISLIHQGPALETIFNQFLTFALKFQSKTIHDFHKNDHLADLVFNLLMYG